MEKIKLGLIDKIYRKKADSAFLTSWTHIYISMIVSLEAQHTEELQDWIRDWKTWLGKETL